MNLFYSFLKALIYIPMRIIFPVKVINKKAFPKDKRIIVTANHLSGVDVPYMAVYFRGYRHFIAKKEFGENFFLRFMAKMCGIILVDRGKADLQATRKIIGVLKKDQGITIFPEGTRNKHDEELQEIKSGVVMFSLRGDAKIVPVIIYKKAKAFRKNYIYVDEAFSLKEFENMPLSSVMNDATKLVETKLNEARIKANESVEKILSKKKNKKNKKTVNRENAV